jgi:hypothetical protein
MWILTKQINASINASRIDVNDRVVITGASPSMYFKDTNERSAMIHMNSNRMYFISGAANSEQWQQVNGQWPLYLQTDTNEAVFSRQVNCDTDSFHYSAGGQRYDEGAGGDIPSTSARRGSVIRNGDKFRPAFSGLYSITVHLFFGQNSTRQLRFWLKLNDVVFNLNGGSNLMYIVTANAGNADVDTDEGAIIVNAVAGQDIKAYFHLGT